MVREFERYLNKKYLQILRDLEDKITKHTDSENASAHPALTDIQTIRESLQHIDSSKIGTIADIMFRLVAPLSIGIYVTAKLLYSAAPEAEMYNTTAKLALIVGILDTVIALVLQKYQLSRKQKAIAEATPGIIQKINQPADHTNDT
ncbi:MAG TPA: hypothetical protein PKL83_06580, partial [bacterium]|nr:hypothetical protein [bacterium]